MGNFCISSDKHSEDLKPGYKPNKVTINGPGAADLAAQKKLEEIER